MYFVRCVVVVWDPNEGVYGLLSRCLSLATSVHARRFNSENIHFYLPSHIPVLDRPSK